MGLILAQFNPNTLKAIYNATTKKQLALETCWNCRPYCPLGHVAGTLECATGDMSPPEFLCATISGMKRCSDDSVIPTESICLEYSLDFFGCHCWVGSFVIDGLTVTVIYRAGINCEADNNGYIYDDDYVWFDGSSPEPCNAVDNDLLITDCGNADNVIDCSANALERTVVAYDGVISVCDPNTGTTWSG